MATNAIDAARAYITDARERSIGAVSAVAVARRLNVTDEQAVALLNCLVETEDLLKINGYLSCPECHEQIVLKGTKLAALIKEGEQLAGRACPFCDVSLPGADDIKVHLSFFFKAVTPKRAGVAASTPQPPAPASTFVTDLAGLKDIQGIQCSNLIVASGSATVMVGETNSQAAAGGIVSGVGIGSNASVTQAGVIMVNDDQKRTTAILRNNPWISGSFYLTVAVVIIVTLMVAGKILSAWTLPLVIIAAVLLICVVGAFQLRNDSKLSEANFLSLMRMTFRELPMIRWFAKKDPPGGTTSAG